METNAPIALTFQSLRCMHFQLSPQACGLTWHRAGWQRLLQTATYGESYRLARKLLDRGLRPGAAAQYRPMQQSKARILLSRLLENPDEWEAHFEL
jgi:cytochrome P450